MISEYCIRTDVERNVRGRIWGTISCFEGSRKTTKSLSQDSWSPIRELNPGATDHEARVIPTWPRDLAISQQHFCFHSCPLYNIETWEGRHTCRWSYWISLLGRFTIRLIIHRSFPILAPAKYRVTLFRVALGPIYSWSKLKVIRAGSRKRSSRAWSNLRAQQCIDGGSHFRNTSNTKWRS
jgi:hypothetical protein